MSINEVDLEGLRNFYSERAGKEVRLISDERDAQDYVEQTLFNVGRLQKGDYVMYWFKENSPPQGRGDIAEISEEGFRLAENNLLIPYTGLYGLERFPSVEGWTFEKRSELKLVERAQLEILSGRIVIIDPGYTMEHYMLFNQDSTRRLKEPTFLRLFDKHSTIDMTIIQGRRAVYLGNFGGDGNYPITKTTHGIEIAIDYGDDDFDDEGQNPDILGSVWVDYKMILLADAGLVRQIDFPPDISKAKVISGNSYRIENGKYEIITENSEGRKVKIKKS